MYLLKNAWISIVRNKGRNILMGIIIMIVACSVCVTLSIKESSQKLVNSYLDKYEIEATISLNRENLMDNFENGSESQEHNIQKFNEIEAVTKNQIISYGTSDLVKRFYYTYNLSMNSSTMKKATQEVEANNELPFGRQNENAGIRNERMEQGDFAVLGYSSYESMTEFIDGKYTIIEGKVSDDFTENHCVINEELAVLNNVSIGDKITLVDPKEEDLTYQLIVTGIFREQENDLENNMMSMFSSSVNTIITSTNTIESILDNNKNLRVNLNPTFILNDKDTIEAFEEEVSEKGMSQFYQITTNLENIELGTQSIENVSTFATTFLVLSLLIGGVVLFVLNMINVRERKYEIGVLRTIGMKKILVMFQFATELFLVSLISLALGAGLGSLSSVPIANQLLQSEILSSSQEQQKVENNFGEREPKGVKVDMRNPFSNINGVMKLEKVTSIHAAVNLKILLELMGIGIILTLISSMSAMIAISRFSPITILKERS